MVRRRNLLVGLVVGLLPVTVLYFDGYWDPQLASFVWASFTVTGWLLTRRGRDLRGNDRWTLLLIVLLVGGAQLGIHMDLPIEADLTVALWYLVLGVGTAAALLGIEIGRRASERGARTAGTTAD